MSPRAGRETSVRARTWRFVGLWSLTGALAACLVAMAGLVTTRPGATILLDDLGIDDPSVVVLGFGFVGVAGLVGATLGVLVARRHPDNPVGWLLISAAVLGLAQFVLVMYGLLGGVVDPGSLPGASAALLAVGPTATGWFASTLLAVWYFPTGRLWDQRWWRLLGAMVAMFAVATLVVLVTPGPIYHGQVQGAPPVHNPLGLRALGRLTGRGQAIDDMVALVGLVLTISGLTARFRRSRGAEREQLKWFLYAGAMLLLALGTGTLAGGVPALASWSIAPMAVPVAVAVAVLRYRQFDIDRLISRTLAYALVTAVLVAAYLFLVLLFGAVLRPAGANSDLAVAGSVLAVAALFQPLRARVQAAVDRRFYRAHYDARRTVEAFGERLREEVDLDAVTDDLVHVVGATVQPTGISLWMRDEP